MADIYNDKNTISAGEVNKFVYCPRQWLYGRVYGAKKLNELRDERNAALGVDYRADYDNYMRGRKFHDKFGKYEAVKRKIAILAAILFIIAVAGLVIFVKF